MAPKLAAGVATLVAVVAILILIKPAQQIFAFKAADSALEEPDDSEADDAPVRKNKIEGPEGYSWTVHNAGRKHSLRIQDGVYRFELQPKDRWPLDGPKTKRNRTEISGLEVPSQGFSSISYDLMIEEADFTVPDVQHVIGQRHGKADLTDKRGEHPSIAFRVLPGGRPSLTVSGSSQQPLKDIPKSKYPWTGRAESLRQGAWHNIRIDAMSGEEGWVDLWLNGELMKSDPRALHTYSGPFGYVNARNDYWKFGNYVARGIKRKAVIRIRNIRRAVGPNAATGLDAPAGVSVRGSVPAGNNPGESHDSRRDPADRSAAD